MGRGGPVAAARADVLARGRGPADHVGPRDHEGAELEPAEHGHLPPAGDRAGPHDHALAVPPRRRARLPRLAAGAPRRAVPGRRRARGRPRDDPRRRHARCPTRCPSTRSRACCAAAARGSRRRGCPSSWCRPRPSSCSRDTCTPGTRRRKGRSATTPATTTRSTRFPVFTIDKVTHRRDPIYHSTYTGRPARRARDPRRGAERGLRADPEKAVPRDRGLLPAAGGAARTAWRSCR